LPLSRLKICWLAAYFPPSLAVFKVSWIFVFDVPEILYFFAMGAFQIIGRREKIGHNRQEVPDETLPPAKESGFDE
jgi:hypothetical protein